MISILINIMEHFFIILTVFEHLVNFRDKIQKKMIENNGFSTSLG